MDYIKCDLYQLGQFLVGNCLRSSIFSTLHAHGNISTLGLFLSIEDIMKVEIKMNALQWINTHHSELKVQSQNEACQKKSVSNKHFGLYAQIRQLDAHSSKCT